MKKLASLLIVLAALPVQSANTNILFISGGATTIDNGEYLWDSPGDEYTNNAGITIISAIHGLWQLDGGYFSTNFPTVWYDVGYGGWPPPDPTGAFLNTPSSVTWGISLTNFWTVPGDSVIFGASGLNMATTSSEAGLVALLDGNILYTSTFTAGKGHSFYLSGHISWDGTNLYSSASMQSGDPSNAQVAQFHQYNSYPIGTNAFQFLSINNTNGLVVKSAWVNASRTPPGTYQAATNTVMGPGSFILQ
jgi:hypothetical protein